MKFLVEILSVVVTAVFVQAALFASSLRKFVVVPSAGTFEPPRVEHDSTSACLLVMDENHHLGEWLAYHYITARLRHVVVAVDPHSKTSPSAILDRFRPYMTIEEWTDSDFTRKNLTFSQNSEASVKTKTHRDWQNAFQMECIVHLKERGRDWTLFVDPDEYLSMNPRWIPDANERVKHPSSIYRLIKEYSEASSYRDLPDYKPHSWIGRFHRPCVVIPRVLFGSHEDESKIPVPSWIADPYRLDTLRWVYRAKEVIMWGKSLIDVSRVLVEDLREGSSAHFPVHSLCKKYAPVYNSTPIGVHHYQGTWEAYSFREDARKGTLRNFENWKAQADDIGGGRDDSIRNWVVALEDMVGSEVAAYWLQDNGLPSSFKGASPEEWARRKSLENDIKMKHVERLLRGKNKTV